MTSRKSYRMRTVEGIIQSLIEVGWNTHNPVIIDGISVTTLRRGFLSVHIKEKMTNAEYKALVLLCKDERRRLRTRRQTQAIKKVHKS